MRCLRIVEHVRDDADDGIEVPELDDAVGRSTATAIDAATTDAEME